METVKAFPTDLPVDVMDQASADAAYLKLVQNPYQRVSGGYPHFDAGIIIKTGQKLYFDGK